MLSAVEDKIGMADSHEFWYAQVLGIFSLNCRLRTSQPLVYTRYDLIWVRWLGRDPNFKSGWQKKRLPRVGFVPDSDSPDAFGFVDPNDIIRAAHLIPAFAHGKTVELLGPSFVKERDGDWAFFLD